MPTRLAATPGQTPGRVPGAAVARILVVDDDEYVHPALTAALRPLRADVARAASAAAALGAVQARPPDLAIVDVGLPDLNGYDLVRRLRAEPGLERMRIILITGHLPDPARAQRAGADEILGKPFRLREFLAAAERCLASGRSGWGDGQAALPRRPAPGVGR